MKASKLRALHRMPHWLAPCVCVAVVLSFPAKAEPVPHTAGVVVAAVASGLPPRAAGPEVAAVASALPPRAAAPEVAAPAPGPATVHVVLTRGPKRLELDLPLDGKVSAATADAIARIMRCRISGRTRRIAPGTLALLADVAARFPGHEIEVVSAVRDEPDRTRAGVKHSKHWDGHAIDIIVRGAKLTEVRDAMWKNHRGIGVGWYPRGRFIHLDYRPGAHDTAWTQARPNADNRYNPRWARVVREASDDDAAVWRAKMRHLLASSATLSTLVTSIAELMGYSTASIVRDPRSS